MADIVLVKNVGSYLAPKNAFSPISISASSTSKAGIAQNGITIDRFKTGGLYRSVDLVALIQSSGSSKYKNKLILQMQDSPTSTAWTAYGSASASPGVIGSTTATGKQKISTQYSVAVDLSNARRYVRVNPILSWSGTNKSTPVVLAVAAVLGGADFNT